MRVLRYSRIHLQTYYEVAMRQTRRSFRYAILAMWIGFLFILAAMAAGLGLAAPLGTGSSESVRDAAFAGGVVVELVAALFLWVYRSSLRQLTYFYDRLMHNHTVVLCHTIAEGMTEQDPTKRLIVEKVLERTWSREPMDGPDSKGLRRLVGPK